MRFVLHALALLMTIAVDAHAAPPAGADMRASLLPVLVREAASAGLPPEIADAVAMVETGYNPDAVGSSGEIGLMQVMPDTASQMGFRGSRVELADPATNIHLGVVYLARAWAAGGQDICRALTKYRAGLGQEAMTPLSAQYCARAIAWLSDASSRLPASLADPGIAARADDDPHMTAMLPPLPEQAGMIPAAPARIVPWPAERASGRRSRFQPYLTRIAANLARLDVEP